MIKKKKKIGILTLHSGINHGAFLQAYALQNFLEKNGFINVIINYKNWSRTIKEYQGLLITNNPKLFFKNILKIVKFKLVHRKLKKTTLFRTNKEIQNIKFDLVIIGSDQVWNFTNVLTGLDYIYFGENIISKNIISYAACFGSIRDGDNIPSEIFNCLNNNFSKISVRDENSSNILKKYYQKQTTKVLDPTFLYDFSKEEKECVQKDFILLYATNVSLSRRNEIINFAKQKGLKIVAISYHHSWADINIIALDPFEWLGYFKKAKFVITSCFHGVVFSIKYKKQFCSFNDKGGDFRIESILNDLEISNRFLQKKFEIMEIFDEIINYDKTNLLLKKEIEKSRNFILNNMQIK